MSNAEISALMVRVKERFPVAIEFGAKESAERGVAGIQSLMAMKEVYTPATDEQIETYREDYRAWLQHCEDRLRRLHVALEANYGNPVFIFETSNEGTRPANDVLITLTAKGRFGIRPPRAPDDDDDEDDDDETECREDTVSELPYPPSPPQGRWKPVSLLSAFDVLRQMQFGSDSLMPTRPLLPIFEPPSPHDPNAFYYKPERPCSPQQEFSLECDQWRHRVRAERFTGEIHVDANESEVSGALECRIHAQNLSESVVKLIPVRIKVKHAKASTIAAKLVDSLCNDSASGKQRTRGGGAERGRGCGPMFESERTYIDKLIAHWRDALAFFSNAQKLERERMVVRAFLRSIGERFSEDEIVAGEAEPVDISFRSARFQIKEALGARKRTDEFRARLRRAQNAVRIKDVGEPWASSVQMPFEETLQLITSSLESYACKLGPHQCSELDALVYVNKAEGTSGPWRSLPNRYRRSDLIGKIGVRCRCCSRLTVLSSRLN